ncbi:carbohydrate porin [uncultured Prochlorococcus sp.]|uniref:carbohydrate porin n=1 Tax=uncultured Prochlorococcus sp. TaxID=159733 RepID=UPI00258850F3|nr:carbohydrate porin [uncultured Prochlorococcus sp.]
MKLFQKLIAAPAIISMASGLAVNASEINSTDLSDYSNSNKLVSLGDFKSDTLFPGDWAYDSLKDLTNSPRFNGNSVTRLEAAAELNNLIAGGEGLMNGAAINRLSDELGSELAIIKGRVDGLEARVNGLEAGAFSETTSASFGVDAILEASDGGKAGTSEAVGFHYAWEMKTKTSFTGDDTLTIAAEAGNGAGTSGGVLDFGASTSDAIKIKDVNYKFPIGDNFTMKVGDSLKISKSFNQACSYGAFTDELSNCGDGNAHNVSGDISASGEYDFDNGFTFSGGVSGKKGATELLTKENPGIWALNAAYEADTYGLSVAYASDIDNSYWGVNGTYSLDALSVSAGMGFKNPDSGAESTSWMAGVTLPEVGIGEVNLGIGTDGYFKDSDTELLIYEASYGFDIADNIGMTVGAFIQEKATGTDDITGVASTISFSY